MLFLRKICLYYTIEKRTAVCHVLLSENIYVLAQTQGEWQKERTYTNNNMEKERNIFRPVPKI